MSVECPSGTEKVTDGHQIYQACGYARRTQSASIMKRTDQTIDQNHVQNEFGKTL